MRDWLFNFNPHQPHAPGAAADAEPAAPAADLGDWASRLQAALGDDDTLLALTRADGAPLDLKLAAIAALSTEAALKVAEREFRDHDRRVHRLAKQRHGHAVAQRESRARAAGLIEDARTLSREALIPVNHLVDIDRAWQVLDANLLEPAQRTEYAALMAQLAALTRERADQPLKLRRWTEQAREALARLKVVSADAAAGAQTRSQLADASAAARAVIGAAPPEATGAPVLDDLARALDLGARLDECLVAFEGEPRDLAQRWEQVVPLADKALDALLQQRVAQWQQAREQDREQRRSEQRERAKERDRTLRDQRLQALAAALDLAEASLAAGQLAPTHTQLVEIDKLLDGGGSAGALRGRIDALQAQYAQLKGWQHWGGGRARDELVQQAEALAVAATTTGPIDAQGVKLSTKQLAELIDDMRARWKDLDRLGGATSRSLWQRFDSSLKSAYEPVARQVAELRSAREQNLQTRRQLLADLEAVPLPGVEGNAPAPDFRALAGALDHFQVAWRRLGPVEHTVPHKARDALLERMNLAVQRIESPLQEARRVARLQRERLIESAKALADGAQGRDLVDRVRDLQSQWQHHARGLPLARHDENALWVEFKTAIDGAFSAREAAFSARDAEFKAHGAERVALVERLEGLAEDAPPAQVRRTLAEVDAHWLRVGPAPRNEAAALDARFRRARDGLRQRLTEGAQRGWQATCDTLETKLALCEMLEGCTEDAAAREDIAQRWSALPVLPELLEQTLAQRAGLPGAPARPLAAPIKETTDELLLQLETAWALASPPAFETARQMLKLQAMKAALETRRPAAPPVTPEQRMVELLHRKALDAPQRERLGKVLAALRRRGPPAAS